MIRDERPVTMQSSNRGVRAANRVDAADDEGRPTGGEVYNRPGGGGQMPPLKKVLRKCVRPIVCPVINCIAITVGLWRLLDSEYRRPMASIRYIIR